MKGLAVTLALVVLFSALLLVATEPSLAGAQKPGKSHVPPAWGHEEGKIKGGQKIPPGQAKKTPGAEGLAEGMPISATQMVTLCHKPGTPAEKTLVLPAAAAGGHLGHGDSLGPCPEAPPAVPTSTLPISLTEMITLCHKPGTPAEKTLVLPAAAAGGHLGHGDSLGPCPEAPPAVPTSTLPISLTETITVCHKPGTPAQMTLILPGAAWHGHVQHGDKLGICPVASAGIAAYWESWRAIR
jgi:hypothetical protein